MDETVTAPLDRGSHATDAAVAVAIATEPLEVTAEPIPFPIERIRPRDHLVEEPHRPLPRARDLLIGPVGVALVVAVAGLVAAVWSSQQDLLLAYADARSHLTIARRLIDGSNRGFVQIGTVWLPLQHLVAVPLVAVRSLWASGWAAVPLGLACLVVEALGVYGIVYTLVRSRLGAWTAALLATLPPAVLYLHTTALTEPVLYAAVVATTYALTRWAVRAKPASGGEIAVLCGAPALAAALARYDGWAFVLTGSLFVAWVAWARWRRFGYAWRATRHFAVLPALGGAWWLWFNWVNYGDPLEFQRGAYSAQAQQQVLARLGLLPDQHDLLRSLQTYGSGVVRSAGWVLLAAGLVGMAVWLVRSRTRFWGLAPWLLVVVPTGFYVLSLYTGQIAMRVEHTAGQGLFNLRYGAAVVAGLGVFAGLLVAAIEGHGLRTRPTELRLAPASPSWGLRALSAGAAPTAPPRRVGRTALAAVVALGLVAAAVAQWADVEHVGVIEEGREQMALNRDVRVCSDWLGAYAPEGTILIDDAVHPMLPTIGADLDRVRAPFIGESRWQRALDRPRRSRYVFADLENPNDTVARAVREQRGFTRRTEVVCRSGSVRVYDTTASGG
jgi:hypothetical protein